MRGSKTKPHYREDVLVNAVSRRGYDRRESFEVAVNSDGIEIVSNRETMS